MICSRLLLVCGLALACGASTAQACFVRASQPVSVWLDHIRIDITDVVAEKVYDCVFKNPNSAAVVGGVCYMEIEPDAQIDRLTVEVDGKTYRAEVLSKDEANKVFQKIVAEGGSPALLEYMGNRLVRTNLPTIAPGGTVTVKLRYTQILKPKNGLIRLQTLNTNPKAEQKALKSASVTVRVRSTTPVRTIYSPTHEIAFDEEQGWDRVVKWSEENYLPASPFVLYLQTDAKPLSASLMTHRPFDEDGTFLLMLSPGVDPQSVPTEKILPKDIVFCIDTSRSMQKEGRLDQAKGALKYCLQQLRPQDRFAVVNFATRIENLPESGLMTVSKENIERALQRVDGYRPGGGTRIDKAISDSLDHFESGDRLKLVLFFTDGEPVLGERDPQKILKRVKKENTDDVRLFVFGGGFDVNARFLDLLALQHQGEADYILPGEELDSKISGFFDRVGSPLLTDLKVEIDGLEVLETYPQTLPDLFAGESVLVLGRYRGFGTKTVTLSGQAFGEQQNYTFELDFPEYSETDREAFVPRLWAGAKVNALLAKLREQAEPDDALIKEVTTLALRYGIVTPYTSYLVGENVMGKPGAGGGPIPIGRPLPMPAAQARDFKNRLALEADAGAEAIGGGGFSKGEYQRKTVAEAKRTASIRQNVIGRGYAAGFDKAIDDRLNEEGKTAERRSHLSALRYIGNRTFYRQQTTWVQGDFPTGKAPKPRAIDITSQEATDLLTKHERLAKYIALGDVILEHDGEWLHLQQMKR